MRRSLRDVLSQPSLANFIDKDFHNVIEKEAVLTELELSKELGLNIGDVRNLDKKLKR